AKGDAVADVTEVTDNTSHSHHAWIGRVHTDDEGNVTSTHFASNLNKALKDMLDWKTAMGGCNRTIYVNAWLGVMDMAHKASNHFWNNSEVTQGVNRTTLKARWGAVWNKKLACRFRMK